MALFKRLQGNMIVAEVNLGGEMVCSVLRGIDTTVPVREVHATRGKRLRAEPAAGLYEQGKIKHADSNPLLEDEMSDFGFYELPSGRSPAGSTR